MILYFISLLFGSIILLILIFVFSVEDRKARLHTRYTFCSHKPMAIDWKKHILSFLEGIKVPTPITQLIDEQHVIWSGIKIKHHHFVSCCWLLILGEFLLMVLLVGFVLSGLLQIFITLIIAIMIALIPFLFIHYRILLRKKNFDRALPDFLDLFILVIESGLGFIPALKRIETCISGGLGDEICQVLIRMDLGYSRQEALKEIINRVPSTHLVHFVESIILSERLGTSLAKTLRVQAKMLRTSRRQGAEIQARTAPIRIIPALVFFFLPGLLLIYLGPPILNILIR